MPSFKPFATAANTLRARLSPSLRTRGGGIGGPSRWTSPGHEERPKGFVFNRPPPPPGESRKWEDWELPYYFFHFHLLPLPFSIYCQFLHQAIWRKQLHGCLAANLYNCWLKGVKNLELLVQLLAEGDY